MFSQSLASSDKINREGKTMTRPKVMCLVVLSCAEISDEGRKELEEVVVGLKKLKNWTIDQITLMEDQRDLV